MKRAISYIGYWWVNLTWGCIMTAIGLCAAVGLLVTGHKPHRVGPNILFYAGRAWGGVSLGPVIIVCNHAGRHTILHECGHGIQNCLWGVLMPFVIAIPSAIRYWYRRYLTEKKGVKPWLLPEYDSVWFEGQATRWGDEVYENIEC